MHISKGFEVIVNCILAIRLALSAYIHRANCIGLIKRDVRLKEEQTRMRVRGRP